MTCCAAALISTVGCSSSPPPSLSAEGKPGIEAGALTVPTKEMPRGVKSGKAKVLIQ